LEECPSVTPLHNQPIIEALHAGTNSLEPASIELKRPPKDFREPVIERPEEFCNRRFIYWNCFAECPFLTWCFDAIPDVLAKMLARKTATAQHDEEKSEDVAEFLLNPENEICFISREER
jgi:hypothetical protein